MVLFIAHFVKPSGFPIVFKAESERELERFIEEGKREGFTYIKTVREKD
jgi:hypothetical protein